MWLWRIAKTRWTQKKINYTVLQEIGERKNVVMSIMNRKVKPIEHLWIYY